jgi:hypothetical protein
VAVIAALLVAADLTARSVAATELSRRLRAAVPEAAGGAVHVRSFPFLPLLLTSGRVPEVDADVRDVIVKRVRFDFIAVELHGVQLDRDQLLRARTIVLQAIERGEVRGEVGQDSLADALGVPVTLEAGKASVEIAGRTVSARLSVADGRLEVSGLGITLPSLDLTGPLLPCLADAVILSGRVALSCDFTEIPEELRA